MATKLREEEAQKRKSHEAAETILAIGEEGKKGVKVAKEYFQTEEKKEEAKRDTYKQMLQDSKGKIITYNLLLSQLLQQHLRGVDWPAGWTYLVVHNDIGVILEMKTGEGRIFRAAFKSVGDPVYDLNAVETYAIRAENTIDRFMGRDRLVVPNGYKQRSSSN